MGGKRRTGRKGRKGRWKGNKLVESGTPREQMHAKKKSKNRKRDKMIKKNKRFNRAR